MKRLPAMECVPQDSIKEFSEPPTATHASGSIISPSLGNTASLGNPAGGGAPVSREAMAAAQRRDIMLEFRRQILAKYPTIKEGFETFDLEFPMNKEMTRKEWRRVLVKLGFDATIEDKDA